MIMAPSPKLEMSLAPLAVYLLSVLGLDLFVGASSSLVTSQRITPAVVLGLLLTPGIPPKLALVADLIGAVSVAASAGLTTSVMAQAGRSLIPAALTAAYLATRPTVDSETYFFACEVFVVVALITRTDRPPFRSDIFLVICYPAVALLLRYLIGLSLTHVLLAVPLLFLLTTVETGALQRYFELKRKLAESQTEVRETRRAQRQSEIESRRKGIQLLRKEQQLSMLNGLGRQMDAAQAAEDIGIFLLKESTRLSGAEVSFLVFGDTASGAIARILTPVPAAQWGLKEGERMPRLAGPSSIVSKEPWPAPMWRGKNSFLVSPVGQEGWLILAREEKDAFPAFLEEFFAAVGRHAGSAILALRRLTEVRAIALRETQEKRNVAAEKEKVAEQNRNLRLLLESFEGLAEGTLASDQELFHQASQAVKRMTGADEVIFGARPLDKYQRDSASGALQVEGNLWPSHIHCPSNGASGNLLCLSLRPGAFSESQLEWCTLLQDFLDKTMENSTLHREVQASYAQLQRTQQEIVVSSQWAAAGRLAANAAHELNTPLGAVRIAADHISLYLEHGGNVRPAMDSMESLLNSVEKCRKVTDRLLLTSRPVDQGAQPLKPGPYRFGSIVRDAVTSVSPYTRASKIKVVVSPSIPDDQVQVVMQDVYWAIVNLMKNAVDAINEGTPEVKEITLDVEREDDAILLFISDTGPGVPDEVRSRLFEPFYTTKKLGQGNGLGLSMSRTNLRRWGGDLEFLDSSEEGGATFVMKVPLVPG